MRKWNLADVAVLDGNEPTIPPRPPYRNRVAAAVGGDHLGQVALRRYTGVIFLLSGEKRLADAWRTRLSEADWEKVGAIGGSLRLFDTDTGEERRVQVVKACLTRSPRRLEVQWLNSSCQLPSEAEAPLLPVQRTPQK